VGAKEDQHILDTEDCQSCFERNSSYRDNTKQEGWMKEEEVSWQAHHILCNHSVTKDNIYDAIPEADRLFAEACLWITKWDLNDAHNMVGLPTNRQHRENDGKVPKNRPSHQVDHNTKDGYTEECTKWLKKKVWNKIKDKGKDHQANADNMRELLRTASDHFRGQLKKRGTRPDGKGTAHCWAHRFEDPPDDWSAAKKASYEHEEQWYFPFSMADDDFVNDRAPGVDWDELVGSLKKVE
jgi:hypothetical protein